jgi:D-glycero-alpha-D-manno-heptose-7-phosphate kinase
MFDEHWQNKKNLAKGISNPQFDEIYDLAKENGALGGKISGAGGGGFFTFYCEEKQDQLRSVMKKAGLLELKYDIDFEGTKTLANFMDYRSKDIFLS